MMYKITYVNPHWGDMIKAMVKDKTLHRLQIAKGHLDKVIQMYVDGEYCINIVHQSLAIQAALKKVDEQILKNHLETCVADSIRKGQSKKAIAEVMEVLEKK